MIIQNNNTYYVSYDINTIAINACLQNILLWKGENPLNYDDGIDYLAVFRNEAFLQNQVENVIDNHRENFKEIEISNIEYKNDIVSIDIIFTMLDNSKHKVTIEKAANEFH